MGHDSRDWRSHYREYAEQRDEEAHIERIRTQLQELIDETEIHDGFSPVLAARSLEEMGELHATICEQTARVTDRLEQEALTKLLDRLNYRLLSYGKKLAVSLAELYAANRSASALRVGEVQRSREAAIRARKLFMESVQRLGDFFAENASYFTTDALSELNRALDGAYSLVELADREPAAWEFQSAIAYFDELARALTDGGDVDPDLLEQFSGWMDRVRAIDWEDPRFAEQRLSVSVHLRFVRRVAELMRFRQEFRGCVNRIMSAARDRASIDDQLRESVEFVRRFGEVVQRSGPLLLRAIASLEDGVPFARDERYSQDELAALKILGLERNASLDGVKAAHRKLLRQYHPDHVGEEYTEKIARINHARDVLVKKWNG